ERRAFCCNDELLPCVPVARPHAEPGADAGRLWLDDRDFECPLVGVISDDLRWLTSALALTCRRVLEHPVAVLRRRRGLENHVVPVQIATFVVVLQEQQPIDLVLRYTHAEV